MALTGIGWAFGEYFLYLLFITRLYTTWRDSIFEVANYVYVLLYIPLSIFLICQLITAILGLCIYHQQYTHITPDIYSYWAEILEHISTIIHAAISLILLYMFTSRLIKLFLMSAANNLRNNACFNDRQETLLTLVIKNTILSSTAIISSQVFFNISLVLVDSFHHLYLHLDDYEKDAILNFIMLAIDCLVNICCMFLSFKFKHEWYLMVCSKCHHLCKWCCTKYVNHKIKKQSDKFRLLSIQEKEKHQSYSLSNDATITETPSSGSLQDIETGIK